MTSNKTETCQSSLNQKSGLLKVLRLSKVLILIHTRCVLMKIDCVLKQPNQLSSGRSVTPLQFWFVSLNSIIYNLFYLPVALFSVT